MRSAWLYILLLVGCGKVLPLDPDGAPVDQDPCTGTCECKVDTDCAGVHTGCNDQITSRTCECVAGYMKNLEGNCEFSSLVADPGFQSTSSWLPGAAAIDTNLNLAGMVDPGAARFTGAAGLCGLPRVTQQIKMPKLSRAEQFVAQVSYRHNDASFNSLLSPVFGIGPSWQENVPLSINAFTTKRFCLGAGQYAPESTVGLGADLAVALMPQVQVADFTCQDATVSLDVDRFDIVLANPNECPTPGTAINGDAEGSGGWVLTGSSANGNPFSTTIDPNVGENNSKGVRLFTRNRCSDVSSANALSIPAAEDVASPALSFFNKTTAALAIKGTEPALGGTALPLITATGSPVTVKACIPAFMRGQILDFSAAMHIDGLCADQPNAESIVDSLKVINDPSCGTDPRVTDPGFESPLGLLGAFSTPGKSLARSFNNAATAHSGTSALQLSVMQLCDGPSWQASVVVPPSEGAAGPALKFFYRATAANHYTFGVNSGLPPAFVPTLDDTYHQGLVCLNPKFTDRVQTVSFAMGGGGGTCATTHPPETAFVDDLELTTDASCAP